MARKDPAALSITSAPRAHSADVGARQRRYLISMGIRTACFVAAVVVAMTVGHGWLMWVLIGASFVLPYVAVVMANAESSPNTGGPDPFEADPTRKQLGQRPAPGGPDT